MASNFTKIMREGFTHKCETEQGNCTYCTISKICHKIFRVSKINELTEQSIETAISRYFEE